MSRMLIHHDDNSTQTSFLMQIRKVVVHSHIIGIQPFGSNIESEVLILVGDGSHHGHTASSLRWNCNTNVVIFRLPNRFPRFPQMSRRLVHVHDLLALTVILSDRVDELNPYQE
jgi:hypothetical protein